MAGFNFVTDVPAAEPWAFPVTIRGVTYDTREPTAAEMATADADAKAGRFGTMVALAGTLIRGDPPADVMTLEAVGGLLAALFAYSGERIGRATARMAESRAAAAGPTN